MRNRAHPLLHLDLQRWRMRLTLALLFGGFAALSARAVYLQVWQSEFLTDQGKNGSSASSPSRPIGA
jgi:cell division protein FtsI/penicillin-binding protein 2